MPRNVDELIARAGSVPRTPAGDRRLAAMLREDAAHFGGLSPGDVDRVRGHILASFEHRSLPVEAVRAVKEELRTSLSPVVIAGAARAARELARTDPECRALLAAAAARIEARDEIVRVDGPDGRPPAAPRTARDEVALVLAVREIGAGSCCTTAPAAPEEAERTFPLCPKRLGRVVVEDQSGRREPLPDLLRDRTTLVAFFYTRCMNPAKCSLTITRLADLARLALTLAPKAGLGILAISYDPDFDAPSRLLTFGRDRNFPFAEHARLLRCDAGWEAVRRLFDLRVGYTAATVNAHARELFVVTGTSRATAIACERLSDPARLLEEVTGGSS